MNLQIELKVCRACLASDTTRLTEADADALKNFHFILNTELSSPSCALLPRTFCDKCLAKLKLSAAFKRQSASSEDYLRSFVQRINQEFAKSLSSRQSSGEGGVAVANEEEHEIELLLQEEEEDKDVEKAKASKPEKTAMLRIEKVEEQGEEEEEQHATTAAALTTTLNLATSELYTTDADEQHLDDDDDGDAAIFNDKEIYDIMEIENNYVDEAGNAILTARDVDAEDENDDDDDDEEEAQFILVNYKSSDEFGGGGDGGKEERFIVEEMDSGEREEERPARKKNMKRMPKEIVEKYAQSTDNNQHMCTKCVKVFSTRTNLIRHIQSHDGNKPYVCNICHKGFTQSGSLKQHVYIHSGERPFKCKYCDRAFTQGKTLKFHLRRHLNEKPFTCSECNTTFRQRDGLKRHLKARHNVDLKYDRSSQVDEKISSFVNMDDRGAKSRTGRGGSRSASKGDLMEIVEESEK